ncbi:MAG: DNA mismatch repair protein MutS, partial [Fidelibacterota bacterium]
ESLSSTIDHISRINLIVDKDVMGLDAFTVRNLEIFKSLSSQGTHGTLIEVLDKTITASGGRMLKQWLNRPLINTKRLNKRFDIVESFDQDLETLDQIRSSLDEVSDIERILGRINNHKVSPKEINGLRFSLEQIPKIKTIFIQSSQKALNLFSKKFSNINTILNQINKVLDKDAPSQIKQGKVIVNGFDKELDELRELSKGGKEWISRLQVSERQKTGIPSLKVGYNRVFGYFLEITKAHNEKIPEDYIRKQTLVNSERYITPELKEYEEKILSADEKIQSIESKIFNKLCQNILKNAKLLQKNALVLSRCDVLSTFTTIARDNKYSRPIITNNQNLKIENGRHPVVEQLLPKTERFIPNDLIIEISKNQIHLITGPNMAGKSTYLRQIGLIVLMAQVGSFVPASKLEFGLVDKLFTRVGASDNLAGGESTFLVEMNEAANILNNATRKSLILLDEIGRGTATYDGLSLAWSITEYLHNTETIAARTLFATHYHELTDLEDSLDRVENYHVAVKEFEDKIIFLRQILPGPGDKSYGIHVAKMAGLPLAVIKRASDILSYYLKKEPSNKTINLESVNEQISLSLKEESSIKEEITLLDLYNTSPLEIIKKLEELKKNHGL